MQLDFNTGFSRDLRDFLGKHDLKQTLKPLWVDLTIFPRLPPAPLLIGETLLNQRFLFWSSL